MPPFLAALLLALPGEQLWRVLLLMPLTGRTGTGHCR